MEREELKKLYDQLKPTIESKLISFQQTWDEGNKSIWHELCFCILTANTSAKMAIHFSGKLHQADFDKPEEILSILKQGYRFPNTRTHYIQTTRNFLKKECGLDLQQKIASFGEDKITLRDYFALTPSIKGLGFKESSHFLRNIGIFGYSILDKHILKSLSEFGLIPHDHPPRNRSEYLRIEKIMIRFAQELEINLDHLDLLLWYRKTGEILK